MRNGHLPIEEFRSLLRLHFPSITLLPSELIASDTHADEFEWFPTTGWDELPVSEAWRLQSFFWFMSGVGFRAYLPIMLLGAGSWMGDLLPTYLPRQMSSFLSSDPRLLNPMQWLICGWIAAELGYALSGERDFHEQSSEWLALSREIITQFPAMSEHI